MNASESVDSEAEQSAEPPAFGVRLRTVRVFQGLSQRAVARRMGRHHSVISRWEAGLLEPTLIEMEALGRALGFGFEGLLTDCRLQPQGRRWSNRSTSRSVRTSIGLRLARARTASGLPMTDVISRTGIWGIRLSRIEAGADPCLRELVVLSETFGADLRQLLIRARLDSRMDSLTLGRR
jgi:transcriptional regulator with XRE-family HTH domain